MEFIIKDRSIKQHRKFDTPFKCKVVRNGLSRGKSAALLTKELGLNKSLLFACHPPTLGETAAWGKNAIARDRIGTPRHQIRDPPPMYPNDPLKVSSDGEMPTSNSPTTIPAACG